MTMKSNLGQSGGAPVKVKMQCITVDDAGQRIDNYLIRYLKGVPKTRIYKALRKGEVRVNGARKKPTYHIAVGDEIRIPPIRVSQPGDAPVVPKNLLSHIPVIYEDESILIVSKPSGLAVHGGSGMEYGLIEALRILRKEQGFLELVHRLDRETSGCLMLAKSRQALLGLQQQLADDRSLGKHYVALVEGRLGQGDVCVDASLLMVRNGEGMKRMQVSSTGQASRSIFRIRTTFENVTLVQVDLLTGRMHQARAHAQSIGHCIAGDRLYGNRSFNDRMRKLGLGRLFLHAESLQLMHPVSGKMLSLTAPLPKALRAMLEKLKPCS